MSETTGQLLTKVLIHAYQYPFTTRSDFARNNAELVAVCACEGFISTKTVGTNQFGRRWHISVMGLMHLRESGEQQ
jgi:hypothetical protein